MEQLKLTTPNQQLASRVRPFELFSRSGDAWLLGGFSILFFLLVHTIVERSTTTGSVATTSYWLTFLINKPHFMISYWFFYKYYRKSNLMDFKWWLASAIVPLSLLILVTVGLYKADLWPFQFLIHAMYFLVGWHYVKQVFGIMMFRGHYEAYNFSHVFRRWLLFNLYGLWIVNWLAWSRSDLKYDFFQIPYQGLHLPDELFYASAAILVISGVAVLWMFIQKYIEQGVRPPLSVVTPLIALYCWYIPVFYHPVYFLFIPLFHSLQYMVFAVSLKRNQIERDLDSLEDKDWRKQFLLKTTLFAIFIIAAGWTSFEYIPQLLDESLPYNQDVLGTAVLTGAATLFINIHHYFIDAVLWRRDSPLMADRGIEPIIKSGQK